MEAVVHVRLIIEIDVNTEVRKCGSSVQTDHCATEVSARFRGLVPTGISVVPTADVVQADRASNTPVFDFTPASFHILSAEFVCVEANVGTKPVA